MITTCMMGGFNIDVGDRLEIKNLQNNDTYRGTVDGVYNNVGGSMTVDLHNVWVQTKDEHRQIPSCMQFGLQFYGRDWIIMAKKENGEWKYKNMAFKDISVLDDSPILLKTN